MINSFALRGSGRFNNFDFLRLFFATLVLFSHCYSTTMTGDARDPLYRLTGGQIKFGELAVDAFFIISGYLITASWINRPHVASFLRNRVLRIYPAYIMICLLCAFVVAPLGGTALREAFSPHAVVNNLARTAALSTPRAAGAFTELYRPEVLNGSLWTIRNEFICYLLVLALGCLDLFTRHDRRIVAALCGISLIGYAALMQHGYEGHFNFPVLGDLYEWPRLVSCYLCGMTFRLYRDRIPYSHGLAALCLLAIAAATPLAATRSLVLPTAGAYLLFYLAFNRAVPLQRAGALGDISYGLYLYGWPIQQLTLHWISPQMSPYALFPIVLVATTLCATLSWKLIEQPAMRRKAKPEPTAPTLKSDPRVLWRRPDGAVNVQLVFQDIAEPALK